ncbi:MAG: TRAP transporter substrate-binding protein DctP [Phascolarctobacterium sp.]|nr:TRAP transporter substrate-binding protein DctP [Phascolarctobacterium sp.]
MKKAMSIILCITLMLAIMISLTSCGESSSASASAEDWEGISITLAKNENDAAFLDELAAAITEATDGKIQITTVDRSSLGSGTDVLAMIQSGALEMTQLSSSDCETGTFPVCALPEVPYFASSPTATTEMMYALWEAGYLDEEFSGIHVLFMWATDGQRMAFVDTMPTTASDFSGLKMRCQSSGGTTMLDFLGASGTKISSSETYMSLQRKVVDGSISSPTAMVKLSYSEVCDYLMSDVLYSGIAFFMCSEQCWDSIPAEYQLIVNEVCEKYRYEYLARNYAAETEAIESLTSNGVTLFDASDDIKAALHEAAQNLIDDYKADLTSRGYDADAIVELAQATVDRVNYTFDS